MTKPIVKTNAVSRVYRPSASREIHALRSVSISVERGQLVSLRGRSGSGKTTLLNCLGGLDQPTSGQIWLDGHAIEKLSERKRVQLRRKQIGFIFQSFALMPTYSAAENIDLMLRMAGMSARARGRRIDEVLDLVGLLRWRDHRPFEMSGGQQQRVAIARAIAARPMLILADEPTGELDTTTSQSILDLLSHIACTEQTTVLIATHDLQVDHYADQVFLLKDGQVVSEI